MKKDAPRKGASFFIWREGSIRPPQYGPALFDDHGAVGLLVVLVNIGCVALAFVGQLFGIHAAFYEEVVNALGAVLGNALVACRRTRLLVGVALDLVDPVFRTALDQVGHQFEAGLLLRRQLRHAVIVENDRSRAEGVHLLCGSGLGGGGSPGLTNFGASVSGFDADFPFAYYAEQIQSLIGANWLKPDVPQGTACVVTFRIQRSGQVTDVKVETPSGLPFYDRAATRSIYAANPLPPLPPEFRREELGVHIRFQ